MADQNLRSAQPQPVPKSGKVGPRPPRSPSSPRPCTATDCQQAAADRANAERQEVQSSQYVRACFHSEPRPGSAAVLARLFSVSAVLMSHG